LGDCGMKAEEWEQSEESGTQTEHGFLHAGRAGGTGLE